MVTDFDFRAALHDAMTSAKAADLPIADVVIVLAEAVHALADYDLAPKPGRVAVVTLHPMACGCLNVDVREHLPLAQEGHDGNNDAVCVN